MLKDKSVSGSSESGGDVEIGCGKSEESDSSLSSSNFSYDRRDSKHQKLKELPEKKSDDSVSISESVSISKKSSKDSQRKPAEPTAPS